MRSAFKRFVDVFFGIVAEKALANMDIIRE